MSFICLAHNVDRVQIELMPVLILVNGYKWKRVVSSCGKFIFIHSCSKLSPSSTDVAFTLVHTYDVAGNISFVNHFDFSLKVRNESSHSFHGFVPHFDPLKLEHSRNYSRWIFDVGDLYFLVGFCSSFWLFFTPCLRFLQSSMGNHFVETYWKDSFCSTIFFNSVVLQCFYSIEQCLRLVTFWEVVLGT